MSSHTSSQVCSCGQPLRVYWLTYGFPRLPFPAENLQVEGCLASCGNGCLPTELQWPTGIPAGLQMIERQPQAAH